MDQNTLYDVLIGIDEVGSSREMNKTLKEMAKSLNIENIPVRIGSKNLLQLTKSIRDALSQGFEVPADQAAKLSKEWAHHLEKSISGVDLKKILNAGTLDQPALPKNFFGEGQLNELKVELAKLSKEYDITVQGFTKNATGQISVLVNGLDQLGNKTSFVLKSSEEGFSKATTSIKNDFDKIFNAQLKVLEGSGSKISAAMQKVDSNPGNQAYKKYLDELNLGYQTLLNNLKDAATYNEYDSKAAKTAKLKSIALADEVNQRKILMQTEIQAEKEAAAVRKDAFTKQKALVKDLQKAIASGNIEQEQEARRLMGINEKKYQDEKRYVEQIATLKKQAESAGGAELAEKTRADLEKAIGSVGRFSKNYTEALEKNGAVSEDFASKIKILQNEIVEYEKKIDILKGKGLITEEEENDLRSYVATLKNLTDETRLAEKAAQDFANQYGQAITPKTAANTKDLVQAFLEAEEAGDKTGQAAKNLARHVGAVGDVSLESRADMTSYNDVVRVIGVTSTDVEGKVKKLSYAYKESSQELHLMKTEYPSVNKLTKNFGEQIQDATKKIAMWGLSTKIVYGLWNSFKDGISVVQELDKELTQIAVVQGATRAEMKSLGDQYADTAIKMRTTVLEVAKLNTELVRQGLSLEESAQRADTIMKLSSAGMISMEQSLAVITSGVNALGESHQKIADVLLKAANITASDVEGLGEAFTKTASGAEAAGLSIEQTTSLLATMKDVTQEGDSQLGTSLKSILARFNKINEETGLMNEDLNTVQTAIESVGISFTDAHGQIRNFYDIVGDLSVVWDDLDKNTQAYIATQAAGTRQQNRFFAIMQNFNSVQAVHNDLLNSAGTLQAAYDTYLQGTEASSKKLKASLEAMWVKAIESDWLKFLAEAAAGVVNLVSELGIFSTILTGVIAKFVVFETMKKGGVLKKMAEQLPFLSFGLGGVKDAMTGLISGSSSLTEALSFAKAGMQDFGAAGGKITALLGPHVILLAKVAAAAYVLGKAYSAVKKHFDDINAARAETLKTAVDLQGQEHSNKATLEELGKEYLTLKQSIQEAGGVYNLSSEDAARYYEVQAEIHDIIPDLAHKTDAYGRVILEQVDNVNQLTTAYDAAKEAAIQKAAAEADGILESNERTFNKSDDGKRLKELSSGDRLRTGDFLSEAEKIEQQELLLKKGLSEYQTLRLKLFGEYRELPTVLNGMLDADPIKIRIAKAANPQEKYEILQDLVKYYKENPIPITFEGKKGLSLGGLEEEVQKINDLFKEGLLSPDEYNEKINELGDSLSELATDSAEGLGKTGVEAINGFIENLPNIRLTLTNELNATEEQLAAQEQERAKAFKEGKEAYAQISSEVQKYADQLDLLKTKGTKDPAVLAMIQQEHAELLRFYDDEARLIEEVERKRFEASQQQRQTLADISFADQAVRNDKASGWAKMQAWLKHEYQMDLNSYTTAEDAKNKVAARSLYVIQEEYRKYFEMVDGQYQLAGDEYEALMQQQSEVGAVGAAAAGKMQLLHQAQAAYNAKVEPGITLLDAFNNNLRDNVFLLSSVSPDYGLMIEALNHSYENGVISGTNYLNSLNEIKAQMADTGAAEAQIAATEDLIQKETEHQALLSGAASAYQAKQASVESLDAAIFSLGLSKTTDLEVDQMIMDQFPQHMGLLGDRTALEAALRKELAHTTEAQIQAAILQMEATQVGVEGKSKLHWELLKLLASYMDEEGRLVDLTEKQKNTIVQKAVSAMGENWGKYFKWVNGQLVILKENFAKAQNMERGRALFADDNVSLHAIEEANRVFQYEITRFDAFSAKFKDIEGSWEKVFGTLKGGLFPGLDADIAAISKLKGMLKDASAAREKAARDAEAARVAAEKAAAKAKADAAKRAAEAEAKKKAAADKKAKAEAERAAKAKAKADEAAAKKAAADAKKKDAAAKKAAEDEKKIREDIAKEEAKVAEAAAEALGMTKEELALRQEIAELNEKESAAKLAEEVFDVAKEFLEWQKELLTEEITDALNKEKEGLLDALSLEEERLRKAEEYNNYLKERKALQDSIANLEYRSAIASLDSSVGGRANQRRLAEELAAERENLTKTEEDRMRAVQDEEFAKRRAKIETLYAEWLRLAQAASDEELTAAELLKLKKLADEGDVHAQKILRLQEEYNQERIYLDSLNALQTGMIRTFTGELIPLEEAYKRLNIQNGKFWTFFGQKDVDNFKDKVKQAMAAVEKYGLKALQQWKDLSTEIQRAEDKLQDYLDSIKNADTTVPPPKTSGGSSSSKSTSSGSGSGGSKSSGSTSTKSTSSGSTSTKSTSTKSTSSGSTSSSSGGSKTKYLTKDQIKVVQKTINRAEVADKTGYIKKVSQDGIFGSVTKTNLKRVYDLYFGKGDPLAGRMSWTQFTNLRDKKIAGVAYDAMRRASYPTISASKSKAGGGGGSGAKQTYSAYSEGGKVDYTGPAMVHGSPSKPEYVFNYPQFKDLAKMIARNQFTAPRPAITNAIPPKIDIQIGNLINVEGNITKDVVPKVERITEHAMTELKRTIKGWGK